MSYIHENHSQFVHILYKNRCSSFKSYCQSSFQNAEHVFVEPLESLMSGFTSSLFQLTVDLAKMFIEIMDSV